MLAGKIEEKLFTKRVYEGKIINLRVDTITLPGGKTTTREVVEHAGAVAIVPINEKNEIILVQQYRYATGKVLLEIPAGKLEPGESAPNCAGRELLEETGYAAADLQELISFFSTPGFSDEKLHIFLARELTYYKQQLDEDENIDVVIMPLVQAVDLIWAGEICDAKTIAGILAVYYRLIKLD